MVGLDYRRVLDGFADPVIAADATNRIVYCNAAAEALLGWPAGDLTGRPLTTIVPPRLRAAHGVGFARYFATRASTWLGRPMRVPALRRDGGEVDVELVLSAVRADGGDLVVAALRDLRPRVELERQVTVTRYLRATAAAAARLTSRDDLDHVLRAVVDTLVADFDAALARVWLYEPATATLHLRASAGLTRETATSSRARIDVATYPYKVGAVARERTPFVANDLAGDPQFDQAWVAREGIAAVAVFPLHLAGTLHGVLAYFARRPLPEELVDVLGAFVAMATAAINDVTLLHAEQAARAAAEETRRRLAFQAAASEALASSLDYAATLERVAGLAVPTLADWCVV
ncbi:MAG TPA: PAS domain S-box protein, partial [Thermomicrobiales bacterium]|nr:PAS domain S-box protein [Thermomicrobiales bacterium]